MYRLLLYLNRPSDLVKCHQLFLHYSNVSIITNRARHSLLFMYRQTRYSPFSPSLSSTNFLLSSFIILMVNFYLFYIFYLWPPFLSPLEHKYDCPYSLICLQGVKYKYLSKGRYMCFSHEQLFHAPKFIAFLIFSVLVFSSIIPEISY